MIILNHFDEGLWLRHFKITQLHLRWCAVSSVIQSQGLLRQSQLSKFSRNVFDKCDSIVVYGHVLLLDKKIFSSIECISYLCASRHFHPVLFMQYPKISRK